MITIVILVYFIQNGSGGVGDLIIIKSNGKYAMIDTHAGSACSNLTEFIKNNKITEFEFVIITHFHFEHMGCLPSIASSVNIKNIYYKYINTLTSDYAKTTLVAKEQIMRLDINKILLTKIVKFGFENFNVHIYNTLQRLPDYNGNNNYDGNVESLVVSVTNKNSNKKVLIAGDIF